MRHITPNRRAALEVARPAYRLHLERLAVIAVVPVVSRGAAVDTKLRLGLWEPAARDLKTDGRIACQHGSVVLSTAGRAPPQVPNRRGAALKAWALDPHAAAFSLAICSKAAAMRSLNSTLGTIAPRAILAMVS